MYRFGKRKKAWDNWCLTNPQIPTWLNLCFKCRSDRLTPSGRSTVTQRYAKPHNKSPIVTVLIDCIVQVCVGFFFGTLHIDTLRSSTKHSSPKKQSVPKIMWGNKNKLNKPSVTQQLKKKKKKEMKNFFLPGDVESLSCFFFPWFFHSVFWRSSYKEVERRGKVFFLFWKRHVRRTD